MPRARSHAAPVDAPIFSAFLLSVIGIAYIGVCAWVMSNVVAHPLLLAFGIVGVALIAAALQLMRRRRVGIKVLWASIALLVATHIASAFVRPTSYKVPLNDSMYLLADHLSDDHAFRNPMAIVCVAALALWLSRRRVRDALV